MNKEKQEFDINLLVKFFGLLSLVLSFGCAFFFWRRALVFALILVELSLPWFNRTMDLDLRMESGQHPTLLPLAILLALSVGLLSGAYPAMFLARFKPVEGIRGDFQGIRRASFFRNIINIQKIPI